jgi:transcriptional regulator with XRE-family HTH domain
MSCDDRGGVMQSAGGDVARRPGYISPAVARRAMLRSGLSGVQVAARVEVNPSTVRNWLSGRTAPTPTKLAALARVLDLDVRDLTGVPDGRESLADMRIHASFTQADVATLVGLGQSAFSTVEQGAAALSDELCAALADAYDSTPQAVRQAWQRSRDTLRG